MPSPDVQTRSDPPYRQPGLTPQKPRRTAREIRLLLNGVATEKGTDGCDSLTAVFRFGQHLFQQCRFANANHIRKINLSISVRRLLSSKELRYGYSSDARSTFRI